MIRTIFSYYETDAWLQRINPTIKLAVVLGYMVAATILFDFRTLILLTSVVLLATWRLGSVPLLRLCRSLLPFLILGLGYLWMNVLFARTAGTAGNVLFQIGPISVWQQGVETGLTLMARALCFGACSLFFVSTVEPTHFILSLVQQGGLSPRFAYAVLAAYRFLPLLESELHQIRAAHRLRGVGEGRGMSGKVTQVYRYTIPLLASAIRRAGRVALAMESRGFTGEKGRTYYHRVRVRPVDWLVVAGATATLAVVLLVSRQMGWLRLWQGSLGF